MTSWEGGNISCVPHTAPAHHTKHTFAFHGWHTAMPHLRTGIVLIHLGQASGLRVCALTIILEDQAHGMYLMNT